MNRKTARRTNDRAMLATALALAVWWVAVLAPKAEAYIDPSAGGMLVQLLLAGTAGVAVLGKLLWSRLKRVFGASDSDQRPPASSDPPTPHDRV